MSPAPRPLTSHEKLRIQRADSRFTTTGEGTLTRHSFSFGRHYDPDNTHFGLLLANNDEAVAPGAGYACHSHRGLDIVTVVVEGELTHEDSLGHCAVLTPHTAQRLDAASGVMHAERNRSSQPLRFIQMWLASPNDGPATYGTAELDAKPNVPGLVASGMSRHTGEARLPLSTGSAALHHVALLGGAEVPLPTAAPYLHVFVVAGTAGLIIGDVRHEVTEGDAARLTDPPSLLLDSEAAAQVLIWEMDLNPSVG